jgi:hypothetical protein
VDCFCDPYHKTKGRTSDPGFQTADGFWLDLDHLGQTRLGEAKGLPMTCNPSPELAFEGFHGHPPGDTDKPFNVALALSCQVNQSQQT